MKVTLIKPNIGCKSPYHYVDGGRMEPLQLGLLAGMTPPDIEIGFYDERMENVDFDEPTDLVAITVETYTAKRSYEISAEYRTRGVPVIMGGMHATLAPEEISGAADAVYIGDAETKWLEVLTDVEKGRLKPVYKARAGIPQPGFQPRRDIFDGKGYLPITLMQFGRGCSYSCEFCATSVYFDKSHYYRRVEEVMEEIAAQSRKHIFFVDDNILANKRAAKTLFRELEPMKIKWVSQATIDMTDDRELMDLMVRSGCLGNVIGFESLREENLWLMSKAPNLRGGNQHFQSQVEVLRDYGLQTWAAFTLGHDHDTVESIKRTVQFAMDSKFTFAAYNILMPYPNTPLYRRLDSQGRLLYGRKWWLHPDYQFNHAAFIPKRMTPEELTAACLEARTQFNSAGSIIRRAFDFKTNMRSLFKLAIYLAYTPLFRRETFKKQDMSFGYLKEAENEPRSS